VTGGTAPRRAWRTANKLAGFAISWVGSIPRNSERRRYLDVGCGSGFITELVAAGFDEVVGIDMEETRLGDFARAFQRQIQLPDLVDVGGTD